VNTANEAVEKVYPYPHRAVNQTKYQGRSCWRYSGEAIGALQTLKKAPDMLNRMQQWIIRLYGRVDYHKTLVAIANKNARQQYAIGKPS